MAKPNGPSELLKFVYHEHVRNFGEPDDIITYGDGVPEPGEEHLPAQLDILLWRPDKSVDMTIFSTVGMADQPMPGAAHRAELHFGIRAELDEEEEEAVADFLANLATQPFLNDTQFDFWDTVAKPGPIPYFGPYMQVLLHPAFVENGWDTIQAGKQEVRLLNVVPINTAEAELKKTQGEDALLASWQGLDMDLFAPR